MATAPKIIALREHHPLKEDDLKIIQDLNIQFCKTDYMQAPVYLGMLPNYYASYYIGADWISQEGNIAITIQPKLDNIDFVEMYVKALEFAPANDYFAKIYSIDFERKEIETDSLQDQLTPLLIIHFLNVVKRIIHKGLKRDCVVKEENLKSKVKGRIKISHNDRINILPQRYDRLYCQYSDYVEDTIENRLLKKALLFSLRYLNVLRVHKSYGSLHRLILQLLSRFENVSENIQLSQITTLRQNKLYRDYNEGLRLAKMILRRFSYSIDNVQSERNRTPPFWIDMSRLYEVYVYSLLYAKYGEVISFQVAGYQKTAVDFIKHDEQLIIDTKYKPQYNDSNAGIIDDVRQLSGYARDEKILKALGFPNIIPRCVIIYPERMDPHDRIIENFTTDKLLEVTDKVKGFQEIYKISVRLPYKN